MPAEQWTGKKAHALWKAQERTTKAVFARRLGVASSTVSTWGQRPASVPTPPVQDALDREFASLDELSRKRFRSLTGDGDTAKVAALPAASAPADPGPAAMKIAIAVVVHEGKTLLVRRRSNLRWQWPAGTVKPEETAEHRAVSETSKETGAEVVALELIGERVHPETHVAASYFKCQYQGGDIRNGDAEENTAVMWVPVQQLENFVERDKIFPPVLELLEAEKRVVRVG